MPLQNFQLFFPVNIILFHGDENNSNVKPNFTVGMCQHYVQVVNRTLLEHPMTNANTEGLMKDFACDDAAISLYVKSKIINAIPQIAYFMNLQLYGVVTYTITDNSPLPKPVIAVLKADLRRQLIEGWGRSEFDIAIEDGILYFSDGIYHLDWKPIGSKTYVKCGFEELTNAALSVRISADDLTYIDTLNELKIHVSDF